MKKIFHLTMLSVVSVFALTLSTTTINAEELNNVEHIIFEDNISTPTHVVIENPSISSDSGNTFNNNLYQELPSLYGPPTYLLPQAYWIAFEDGGFGRFSQVATSGDEAIYNMLNALISSQLYDQLERFNSYQWSTLGYVEGSTLRYNLILPGHPIFFSMYNDLLGLGYSNHRGWDNVWGYNNPQRFGAGMHDRSQSMIRTPQQYFNLITQDGTIMVEFKFRDDHPVYVNTCEVILTRINNSPSVNPVLYTHNDIFLYTEFTVNRWNQNGTRINDLTNSINVAIINPRGQGPLAAWDISAILEEPPHITISPKMDPTVLVNSTLEPPSHYVDIDNLMGGNVYLHWVSLPDLSTPGQSIGTIEVVETLGEYVNKTQTDIVFNVK